MPHDSLNDFEKTTFTHEGKVRDIYRIGTGPAVIVIAEMPGITPKVASFARRVADIGCTAVMPHLYGRPGVDPKDLNALELARYSLSSLVPACISSEFTVLATGKSSPVIDWLRALGRDEHERCGGPGIGAIGMCFTGGFALAMATDETMLAPVLSQPSQPLPLTRSRRRTIDISPEELEIVKGRCAAGLKVIGARFTTDPFVPPERFAFLREQLGDAFVGIELPPESARPDATMAPHSVVTEHLIDEPGEPTRDALDQILDLFRERLELT